MRAKLAVNVEAPPDAIDTCGTGGDGADTFNISTAAALIVAGAGVPVAKHGNKRSIFPSPDRLTCSPKLGVKLDVSAGSDLAVVLTSAGVGFMFAALHHQAAGQCCCRCEKALGIQHYF